MLGHQQPSLCAGKREWPAFRDWFARNLAPALNSWMGDVEVVYEGKEMLDPGSKYVFGYAPHGLFPIGVHTPILLKRISKSAAAEVHLFK